VRRNISATSRIAKREHGAGEHEQRVRDVRGNTTATTAKAALMIDRGCGRRPSRWRRTSCRSSPELLRPTWPSVPPALRRRKGIRTVPQRTRVRGRLDGPLGSDFLMFKSENCCKIGAHGSEHPGLLTVRETRCTRQLGRFARVRPSSASGRVAGSCEGPACRPGPS
jgi:hypothetical protein